MAVIFQTVFDEADFSAWDIAASARSGPLPGFGINGGSSNTCNSGSGGSFGALIKDVVPCGVSTAPPWGLPAVSVRMQYAILANTNFDSDLPYILSFVNCDDGLNAPIPFGGFLAIRFDGTMRLNFNDATIVASNQNIDSASGVFPIDGTIHGIQLVLTIATGSVDYELTLDNVTVLSGTFTPSGVDNCSADWGFFKPGAALLANCANYHLQAGFVEAVLVHYRDPMSATPVDVMTNCAEFIVDDTASTISYPACNAAPLTPYSCGGVPPFVVPLVSPPLAPQTPCTPAAQIGSGGKGNSGCTVGGVGRTPTYTGPYGTVAEHVDPVDGELLTDKETQGVEPWIELPHVDDPSLVLTTYRRAFVELGDPSTFEGGRKVRALISLGAVQNSLGNELGMPESSSVDVLLSDADDGLIRILMATQELEGDEIRVKLASDALRNL